MLLPPSLCPGLTLQINLNFRLQLILPWNACLGADAALWSPGMPSSHSDAHTTWLLFKGRLCPFSPQAVNSVCTGMASVLFVIVSQCMRRERHWASCAWIDTQRCDLILVSCYSTEASVDKMCSPLLPLVTRHKSTVPLRWQRRAWDCQAHVCHRWCEQGGSLSPRLYMYQRDFLKIT